MVAAGAALLSLGGVVGATFVKSPEQLRAETAPVGLSTLTAVVEKRVLASTVVTRGLVTSAQLVEITPASAQGAAVTIVTGLNVKTGDPVKAGQVLATVSGRPIVVLPGIVPAYRDLRPGDSGADVAQLQQALEFLGHYRRNDKAGYFGGNTKDAVNRFYTAIGFAVPDTGGPGGRGDRAALRAAANAVETARQLVDSLTAQLASASGAPGEPGQPSVTERLQNAKRALDQARSEQNELIATTGAMLPMAEVAFVPSFPTTVTKLNATIGKAVSTPMISLATGRLEVQVKLRPDQNGLVSTGMRTAILAEALGETVQAQVSAVGALTTAQAEPTGAASAPFVPVVIATDTDLAANWNGLDVRVTITAAQTEGEVLVVPVSAVSAGADGRTTVSVLGQEGTVRRVEVRVGVNGNGFVEVSAINEALRAGDRVVVGI